MKLKMKREYFDHCPIAGFILVGGQGTDVIYKVSDNFIRDLRIELSSGAQSNYDTILIRLIFKANLNNLAKLSKLYPAECLTVWAYQNVSDFYKQFIE